MNSKKELWILLASFVLPIAFGAGFFYWNPFAFTSNTVNYGQFVNPVIATEKHDIVFTNNTQGELQGVWTLVYATSECDNPCVQALKDMKTIHTLTNENMRRVQRLLLTTGVAPTNRAEAGLLVARPSKVLRQTLREFPNPSLFLIDPLGNLMLRYNPQTLDIKRVLKDFKRLLKYSRIG